MPLVQRTCGTMTLRYRPNLPLGGLDWLYRVPFLSAYEFEKIKFLKEVNFDDKQSGPSLLGGGGAAF